MDSKQKIENNRENESRWNGGEASFAEKKTCSTDLKAMDESVRITQLPKLSIAHDEAALEKLRALDSSVYVAVVIDIVLAITAFLLCAASFVLFRSHGISLEFFEIASGFVISLGALLLRTSSKSALMALSQYFKKDFVRAELEAICQIDSFQENDNTIEYKMADNEIVNYFSAEDAQIIHQLGIGRDKWNVCEIKDSFSGEYMDMKFKLLDIKQMNKMNDNDEGNMVFQGQIYIFETKYRFDKPIQYCFYPGNKCQKRSDFKKAFAPSYYYYGKNNPFDMTHPKEVWDVVMRGYQRETGDEFARVETTEFIDNMLRLGQHIPDALWSVRFDKDAMILILSRPKNIFELDVSKRLNKKRLQSNMERFDAEMQEFAGIMSIVSRMENNA